MISAWLWNKSAVSIGKSICLQRFFTNQVSSLLQLEYMPDYQSIQKKISVTGSADIKYKGKEDDAASDKSVYVMYRQ